MQRDSKGKFIKGHRSFLNTEGKLKISKKLKGLVKNEQWRKRLSDAHKGKKLSPEHIKKISDAKKGKQLSIERIQKMLGKRNALGKHNITIEGRRKMVEAQKGKKHSKERREKIAEAQRKRWLKTGKRERPRHHHVVDEKYKTWRNNVFKRDNWTCQNCNKKNCYLEAHHIKSWAHYPDLRHELTNGLTLCKPCHQLTDNYKNKKKKI